METSSEFEHAGRWCGPLTVCIELRCCMYVCVYVLTYNQLLNVCAVPVRCFDLQQYRQLLSTLSTLSTLLSTLRTLSTLCHA